MIIKILLSVFLLGYHEGLAAQTCDPSDCVPGQSCPAALERASQVLQNFPENALKLRQFFEKIQCEVPYTNHTMRICCSKMSLLEPFDSDLPVPDSSQVSIDDHPNLNLLPDVCGPVRWSRILLPIEQDYPWLALISVNRGHLILNFQCSGSLINDRYVLTSAQCIKGKHIAGVRLGEADRRLCERLRWRGAEENCHEKIEDVEVEEIHIHEKYGQRYRDFDVNDIALIRLRRAVSPNIVPLCLPKTSELRQKNLTEIWAQVADWKMEQRVNDENELPKISSCVLTPDRILCNTTEYSCEWDVGSPVMVEDAKDHNYRFIQYGVMVRTYYNCFLSKPTAYVNVIQHMKWILDHLKP